MTEESTEVTSLPFVPPSDITELYAITLSPLHMTEQCVKLISSGSEEPMSLKLSFSIQTQDTAEFKSPEFNICNIAKIQFYLKHTGDENTYFISVIKVKLAKELGIQTQVVCKKPEYNGTMLCTEKWSQWQRIGNSKDTLFNVQIKVIMSKADLMVLKLYNDEEFTDFQLSTAEGNVAVHRVQMAVNSDVFKTMLIREWKETTEARIEMEGVTLQTLQDLKDYMYLGALPDNRLLCPLMLIAWCYLMETLKAECITKLTQTVSSKVLFDVLEFSFFNQFPELTFAVLGAISKSMVDDAHKIMFESQKGCKKEADETTEQEQIKE